MKASIIGGYTLIILGCILGAISLLSLATSIPMFLELNTSEAYNWGFIIGRIFMIILLFLLAKVSISKGKKIKALSLA
ncbi:hypothetical protein J8L86_16410 [Shewanella sp. MMG014]|uniref:hypothetical protein n=1 Tax=Shewanella sp. MMG014 TaxID=2822691 RepID=UPI001B3733EF|nr:hypothetical protein [Shewanella sp. MMG014]MBQ4891439.1 hypothetical protein [Shewanella sp. MMG014]